MKLKIVILLMLVFGTITSFSQICTSKNLNLKLLDSKSTNIKSKGKLLVGDTLTIGLPFYQNKYDNIFDGNFKNLLYDKKLYQKVIILQKVNYITPILNKKATYLYCKLQSGQIIIIQNFDRALKYNEIL